VWKYFTDLFDFLPLTALIEEQVRKKQKNKKNDTNVF